MTQNTSSPTRTFALLLLVAVAFSLGLTLLASPAQAHTGYLHQLGQSVADLGTEVDAVVPACTTDYQCALVELGQAMVRGERIEEDLSFAGASEWYAAKNELIADRFWAEHDGLDWSGAKYFLGGWVDAQL